MISRVSKQGTPLPELWKSQLPTLRRRIAEQLKAMEQQLRNKAHSKFKERINKLAKDHPKKLLRLVKEPTASPTNTAITKEGRCLTTSEELSQEAERHLRPYMAPPPSTSPFGDPATQEAHLTGKQSQNRQKFKEILHKYAPRPKEATQVKLRSIMRTVSIEELRQILRHFKRSSYTPDIPIVLLKEAPDTALEPLRHLMNTILKDPTALTPEDLTAHMILLPKEDPLNLAAVRPITMCGTLYKLVAYTISSRLNAILESDHFLLRSNVGFTPHGETHHLIMALQAMFDANQATPPPHYQHMHALMVDLSRAYDTVPWFALLETLQNIGLPPALNTWLLHTLQNSSAYLKFPQGLSEKPLSFRITRGVKQGCPLSPILYAIFNDTLLRWIHEETASPYLQPLPTALGYADDLALLSNGPFSILRKQLSILSEWEELTQQSLNVTKTKILTTDWNNTEVIHKPGSMTPTHPIEKVNTFKYLGVIVRATATKQTLHQTRLLAQTRLKKATQGLNKLKHLPLSTATKAAVIRSAIHSVIPYGVYAVPPRALPLKPIQTLTNDILKGGPKHRHMSNAISQHPRLGEDAPNIQTDMPYLAIAELHRILNTPNFTQEILIGYLQRAMTDHAWPHHPLDPATLHLKLLPQWKHSLLDVWRQWLLHSDEAVRPSFITTTPELNPGGWTNFFSSTRFDYHTATTNRHPWLLPEATRERLALLDIFNAAQLQQAMTSSPTQLASAMSQQDREAIRLQILADTQRRQLPTAPVLFNPWKETLRLNLNPLPANSYTVADGAATTHAMAAAWAVGTRQQYFTNQVPPCQKRAQPVYGTINSTVAETYGLEGALIMALQTNAPGSHIHTTDQEGNPTHYQDNQGVLQTFAYYQQQPHVHEGRFVTKQQARPAWRRIREALPLLTSQTLEWKQGHADNRDINVVDLATKTELHHHPWEHAATLFPDLNPFIHGMDQFSLLLTFPSQPGLPIAHPLLPTPNSTRQLRPVLLSQATPALRVTLRHDGTRSQLHNLWRYLLANHKGRTSPTFRFISTNLDLKNTQASLATYQIGYWISMRATPTDDPIPPIDSPITMAERTLILRLRQGLWVVHQQTPNTDPDSSLIGAPFTSPGFRMCDHCNQIATLHHILCECARPALIAIRQHLQDFMIHVGAEHIRIRPQTW
jgi:hypothetical protein